MATSLGLERLSYLQKSVVAGFTDFQDSLKTKAEYDMNSLEQLFKDPKKALAENKAYWIKLGLRVSTIIGVAVAGWACSFAEKRDKPVSNEVVGPRSTDTNIAPIRPMLIDGNFVGADEIKKSCELIMGGNCEVFGVVVPKENADPKIHPFVTHEGVDYVWGGSGRFDRLYQKPDQGKIKWVDDDGNIYFVGVPEAGSTTQLETLYYVDPDGKVLELPKPWGKLLASGIKPTPTTPATATSTKEWTPTPFSPTLTPIPPTVPRPIVVVQPTQAPRPTVTPKLENKPIVESDGVERPGFVSDTANYLGNKLWSDKPVSTDCRIGKENDPRFQLDQKFVYEQVSPTADGYSPGRYYQCQFSDKKLVKITIWTVK